MSDDWDAEDFEIKIPSAIKSNWEDEEVIVEKAPEPVIKVDKPKEKKEKVKKTEQEETNEVKELTEEEKKAAQEEADLKNSLALMGLDKSLDEVSFETKDDVNNYIDRLYARLNKYNTNANYFDFLDGFLKTLSKNLPTDTIRKLSKSYQKFADQKTAEEKEKLAKEVKPIAKSKTTAKKTIKVERDNDFDNFGAGGGNYGQYEEFDDDDFM